MVLRWCVPALLILPAAGIQLQGTRHNASIDPIVWGSWTRAARTAVGCAESRGHLAGQTVLFGSHHKTGTVLMEQVKTCLDETHPEIQVTVDEHAQGFHAIEGFSKIVHWVRNPFSVVVSSYLYHKNVGEGWGKDPGSAAHIVKDKWMGLGEVEVEEKESYKEFLQRMPAKMGLHTELRRFLKPLTQDVKTLTGHEGLEIESAHHRCAGHHAKCLEVCLEPFMAGSSSYMTSWKTVMEYIGICMDEPAEHPLRQCLKKADINSPRFDGYFKHITKNTVPDENIAELNSIVKELDRTLHSGAARALEESFGCVPS